MDTESSGCGNGNDPITTSDPKNLAVTNTPSSSSPTPSNGPLPINLDTVPSLNKDKGVGSSVVLEDGDNHDYDKSEEEKNIGKAKAPVPGNCCNFSTITCSRFWAIFNLVQLFFCWILVCAMHVTTFVGNPDPHETVFTLFKCMEGGSVGAQNTRLAFQIILLLVYTAGSIMFVLCNYPPKQVVSLRPIFAKIYTWTIIAFILVFAIPFIFHLPIGECYYFISVTFWTISFIKLSIGLAVAYFSWRVAKLYRNYLLETAPPSAKNGRDEATEVKDLGTPPLTPQPSKNDFGTQPPTPKPSIDEDEIKT